MKAILKTAISLVLAGAALLAQQAIAAGAASPALLDEAKVTEADAKSTALARVPHGVVKSAELEREHGKLVWSFDIAQPSVKGVTEVQIDAITGKIVSFKRETPAQEAKEMKAEAKEAKAAAPISK